MEWIMTIIIGLVIGLIVSFIVTPMRMPQSLCLLLGAIGGAAGGALQMIAGSDLFGPFSFYLGGAIVAIGLLAGGTLVFFLTHEETRV